MADLQQVSKVIVFSFSKKIIIKVSKDWIREQK